MEVSDLQAVLPFLAAYPYPAFILETINAADAKTGRTAVSLNPVWTNGAFKRLFSDADYALLAHLGSAATISLGTWLEAETFGSDLGREGADTALGHSQSHMHLLTLDFGAHHGTSGEGTLPVHLELVKTRMGLFTVITSVPRTSLPSASGADETPRRKKNKHSMKLLNLPRMGSMVTRSGSMSSSSSAGKRMGSVSPSMDTLMKETDWSKTALGPREHWDHELETVLEYVRRNPNPVSFVSSLQLRAHRLDHCEM